MQARVRILPVAAILLLAGCYTEISRQRTTTASNYPKKWVPAVSLHAAQALSADEAKAILIARAAVEEMNRDSSEPPAILELAPTREEDGWSVHVTFVGGYGGDGSPGRGPGYFCVVKIDKAWKVTGIVSGA